MRFLSRLFRASAVPAGGGARAAYGHEESSGGRLRGICKLAKPMD